MPILYPRTDVMENLGAVSQVFKLLTRNEFSRQANGVTIPKSMGSSIWIGEWTTRDKFHDDAIDFEAILNSLDDGLGTFKAYDTRRLYPKMYPTGNFDDSALVIQTIEENAKWMTFSGAPADFQFSRGDYFEFSYGDFDVALHQIMEDVQANELGIVPIFEVRPHLRPGALVGTSVSLKKPSAKFRLFPQQTNVGTTNILQSNASIKAFQVFE